MFEMSGWRAAQAAGSRSHNQTGALRGLRCLAEIIKATAQVEVDLGS